MKVLRKKKKRIGVLYGKPVVEGLENELKTSEILAKKENDYITLAARNRKGGEIKSLSAFSSIGNNYGDSIILIDSTMSSIKSKVIINPKTLKDVFYSCFIRDSASKVTPAITLGSSYNLSIVGISSKVTKNTLADKDFFRQWLINSLYENTPDDFEPVYIFNNIRACPILNMVSIYSGSYKGLFKNGCIQGIYCSKGANTIITPPLLSSYSYQVAKTNNEGVEVQDTFYMLTSEPSSHIDADVDSSYIVVPSPIFFISPFVNALFALAIKSDDDTLVLVNCMDIDTSFLRKLYGISEYAVIPAPKEGEYIEASLWDSTETMALSSKEPNSFLLEKLKNTFETLAKNIKVDTETEAKAVVD